MTPSTRDDDHTAKREYYARAGVPEYWIVELEERALERWRPGDKRPEVVQGTLVWQPDEARPPFQLDLRGFFGRVHRDAET